MVYEKQFEQMESIIVKIMQRYKIPGLSLCVIKEDKTVYSKAFGAKNLERNEPTTINTLYGIGSITKSFTTLAIMQLVEKGLLSLNDPISKYLPIKIGFKDDPITIHHFLSHSSGLPGIGYANILIFRHTGMKEAFVPMSSLEDVITFTNNANPEIADKPGKRYFYCNIGFALLGAIIELISKIPYEKYIREKILTPLEMNRSTFSKEEFEKDNDKMTAYIIESETKCRPTTHPFDKNISAAGGLLSSVNEMKNYLIMYFQQGKFKGKEIVKSESIEKMWQIHINRPDNIFGKDGYGYGFGITENFFGERLIQHSGSTLASSAHLAMIPKKKLGVIIEGNVGNIFGGLISQCFLAILLDKDPIKDHPLLQLEQKLLHLEGNYETYKGIIKLKIIRKGSILYAENEEDKVHLPLIPENNQIEDYRFWTPLDGVKYPIHFTVDEKTKQIDFYYERNRFHKVN